MMDVLIRLMSRVSSSRTIIASSSPAAQHNRISVLGIRSLTSQISPQDGKVERSFPVSYLMSSLGFSLDRAKSSSRFVNFRSAEKPNAVLNLLRSHGFSATQIAKCIKYHPRLLVLDPERILRPKLDFLLSKLHFLASVGISRPDLTELVSSNPNLLVMSLEKCTIPRYNLLKDVLVDDVRVVNVLKYSQRCVRSSIYSTIVPNLTLLRKLGAGKRSIAYLVSNFPNVAFMGHSSFVERVELAKQFGFDPLKSNFVDAIRVFSSVKKSSWEKRLGVYGRWGWSKDLTFSAFRKYPQCMCTSEEKITQVMDFIVHKLGWESEAAARCPIIFGFSFEKRVVPRCSVLQLLRLKGLIDDIPPLSAFLNPADDVLKDKFVHKYPDVKAELLDVYEGRVNVDFRTMTVEAAESRS